jgi:homocysteine S-methyltransferase
MSFRQRLASGPPLLLDGPTGTELERHGVDTSQPQWSAAALVNAPEVVRQIHDEYVAAGGEVLTANTFRTHERNLRVVGWEKRAAELTTMAVDLARDAARNAERPVWIAGSQAPLADCYSPELTADDDLLEREHLRMSQSLANAGVDLILVETHPTLREALAAARAALSTGLPVVVSVVCNRAGQLLSGESLAEAGRALAALPVSAIGVNCIVAEGMSAALSQLRAGVGDIPLSAYANVGYLDDEGRWVQTAAIDPEVYSHEAEAWPTVGARLIGSCCGTTVEHIRRLRSLIDSLG